MFTGTIFQEKKYWYFYLIFPLVQAKKLFEIIYQFLMKAIWDELLYKKTFSDGSILFLISCVISLLLYRFRNYNNLLIISSILIWYIDCSLARNQYINSEKILTILQENIEDNSQLILEKQSPDGKVFNYEFTRNEVKQISLSIREIKGGAFQEVIAKAWQIEITLMDNYVLEFDEEFDLLSIFNKAKTIAEYLQVPLIFLDSEGFDKYVQINIKENDIRDFPSTIKDNYNYDKNQWHIYYQWNLTNSWHLLKQIFAKGGFFLLILITNWLLLRFGFVLNFVIAIFTNNNYTIILPSDQQELYNWLFKLEGNFLKIIGIILAIIIMISHGVKISQEKHIFIDKDYLKFYINHQLINQTNIQTIQTILFINKPFSCLYILTSDSLITISEFQKIQEFQTFLVKIEQAISSYLKI